MSSNLRAYYEDHYAKFDRPDVSWEIRIKLASSYISRFVEARDPVLVELGCGTGAGLTRIKASLPDRSFRLLGTDISEHAVDAARAAGIQAYQVDLNTDRLPFESDSVDVLMFLEVIEHLYDSDRPMHEIRRVLKPGGLLVISTPNLASWANRLAILMGYQPFSHDVSMIRGFGRARVLQVNGHLKSFTRRALLEYVQYFRLEVVEEGVTPAGGVAGAVSAVDGLLSRFPALASHTVLACVKH